MKNRTFRTGTWVLSAVSAGVLAIASACSSSDPDTPAADAGNDTTTAADTSTTSDGSTTDGGSDGAVDGGNDAAEEAAPPAFCKTYPNVSADAAPSEGPRKLYELIALRALLDAMSSCEIGSYFPDLEDPPPSQITCFGKQLASVAGCLVGGAPIDYASEIDENGAKCVPPPTGVGKPVQLGFRDPEGKRYSANDVDFMVTLVRKAAISTGMPAADADKLKALLEAQRSKALLGDAGDAGYTNSTCP